MIGASFTWGGATVAGLAGTAAMTLLMYMVPLMGLPRMDIIGMLGAMVTTDNRLARAMGTLLHAVMGIIFALIYARIWEVMQSGPVTFRPNMSVGETAAWMDRHDADSVLVTSSDGTLIGMVRREDLAHG